MNGEDFRMIAVIGTFDQNGVYGFGPHAPWGNEKGGSDLLYDYMRFEHLTKELAPEGKRNVLISGPIVAEALRMHPLPNRRLIVISNLLDQEQVNVGRKDEDRIVIARDPADAKQKAFAFEDCGSIFFIGGHKFWLDALDSHLCTHAFITVLKCDSVTKSGYKGETRRAPEMLQDTTYTGLKRLYAEPFMDVWGEDEVETEIRAYLNK